MDRLLDILEEKISKPEEIFDEEKLRYIASQIYIWDFLGVPQSNYIALYSAEKSRMFNEYYKKLVLKYFVGKSLNFFCLIFSQKCLRLSEVFSGF